MSKTKKLLLLIAIFALAFMVKSGSVNAAQYIWPIAGSNANETYIDYEYYGNWNALPIKNGKYGREYIVDNTKWPNEKYYYSSCESHYGMDITGINGHTYKVVSVVDGTVIATSGNAAYNPSTNFADQNQRRTLVGMNSGGGYGNYIIIQETSTGRCFLYGHLKGGSFKVSKGSTVKAGQEIATMGSSGDSGHMHLHFEIRKSKDVTIYEYSNGTHYLVITNSNTNLDPEDYIGSTPNVRVPVEDKKLVQLSDEDMGYYVRYLYRTVLKTQAKNNEIEYWVNRYKNSGSIAEITKAIFLSNAANSIRGELSNLELSKKAYEIILFRGNNYTEQEMAGHVNNMNTGKWLREDYITNLCNSVEFTQRKIYAIIAKEKLAYKPVYGIASEDKLNTLGDLDADGCISAADATICLQLYSRFSTAGIENSPYKYAIKYADVDGDGVVSATDASFILSYYASLSVGRNEWSLVDFVNRQK